jgi:DNA repair protein RadC
VATKSETANPGGHPMVRDLPTGERPRQRMVQYGPRSLSNTELVAILLRTGVVGENVLAVASRVLAHFGGLAGLGRADYTDLCRQKGLSEAKACQLLAAMELGRRFVSLAPEERATINSPQDVANLLGADMATLEQEHLRVVLLNTRNAVLSIHPLYVGTVNHSVVRGAEVFRLAIKENATALIVVHNHPSGDPTPSAPDVAVTRELIASGKMLDIEVMDHIVIGSASRFVSMKESRLGFS